MRIEHVALWATELESMKTFYETYFEATSGPRYYNQKTGFTSYFLSFTSGARVEIMHKKGIEESAALVTGYAHLAFSVGTKQAVDALTERLVKDGFSLLNGPRTTGDGYYESVVADPEGNLIEITTD
ncbi:VOC family protein [Marinilactibacillus kalidii]|uniref:VOC family protein n=1 Tax=Marinilactibacillus kalidii TaxID=2820274 RepID=UPI001ABE2B5E|nr:VOC family protein [Marinilactibacillus kalidii]